MKSVVSRPEDEYSVDSAPGSSGIVTTPLAPPPLQTWAAPLPTPARQSQVEPSSARATAKPPTPLSTETVPEQKENKQDGVAEGPSPSPQPGRGGRKRGPVPPTVTAGPAPAPQNTFGSWFKPLNDLTEPAGSPGNSRRSGTSPMVRTGNSADN
jgi:hypothetical protein